MADFFVFPFKFDDILEETSDSRYWISSADTISTMDERHIKRKLGEIEKAIFDDYSMIRDSDRFDFLFYWIKFLEEKKENFPIEFLEETIELLLSSIERLIKKIESEENEDYDELRNCFKMMIFLLFFFMKNTRVKKLKNSLKDEINEAATQLTSKTGKKKTKAKNKKDMSTENLDKLMKRQIKAIFLIKKTLSIDFKSLWNRKQIDDEFFKYYVETCLTMLESKVLLKENEVKQTLFNILEYVLGEYPDALKNVQIKLINLIYEDENIVDPISDFIIKGYNSERSNMVKLSTETLLMLVNYVVEKTNVNNESQAVKNTKDFLCKVSEKIPKLFYNNLSSFMALYDSEAYLLRNALSEIIANIIQKVLTNLDKEDDSNFQENHLNMKKKLLERLIQRVYDKHAFCRSHSLGLLANLCENNTIPRDFLMEVFKKACDRIKDVSANVRKRAIQLLTITVQYYYVIFVESQKQMNSKKFLTKLDLEKDISENKSLEEELRISLEEIEKNMMKIEDPLNEEINDMHSELNSLKRKLEQTLNLRKYLVEYRDILIEIDEICPNLEQLLGSKNLGDIQETVRLLTFMNKFNIESSKNGIKKMMVLIWSKEKSIKEEILKAYYQLYFDPKEFDDKKIAYNMVKLLMESTMTEATSLEELFNHLIDWNNQIEEKEKDKKRDLFLISNMVFKSLWDLFLSGISGINSKYEMRCALQILRICSSKNKEIITQKFDSFSNILTSFTKKKNVDWIVVKEISIIIEKSKDNSTRTNNMIKVFMYLLIKTQGTTDTEWFAAAEQIINMIFVLKRDPDNYSQYLIVRLSKFLYERIDEKEPQNSEFVIEEEKLQNNEKIICDFEDNLAQLIFVVGHVGIKFLIYIDNYENELKKMKNEAETKYQANLKENPHEDLDKIQGGFEAEFEKKIEYLHQISEKHLLQENLLSNYLPIVRKIANDMLEGSRKNVNEILDRVVLLTFCKFMCVSGTFCKENLELLFKLMSSDSDPIIKNNVIISLGDLMHRYPNIIEPYTNNVYQNLRDIDPSVRKTTLLVITHLILNDMLKLKGEICDVALLLEDSDSSIQNLVKLFFHELHKKDPKLIYNLLPEAIGRMSKIYENNENNRNLQVDVQTFQNFAKNIMPYLEKDKYSENLVEKLCARFKNTTNNREWKNTAYCMSLLAYNEKGLRKLLEMYECYRDKLSDSDIMESFKAILAKIKKYGKIEMKNLTEEWESKLNNYATENNEERRKIVDKSKKIKKIVEFDDNKMDEEKENKENKNLFRDMKIDSKKKLRTNRLKSIKKSRNSFEIEVEDEDGTFSQNESEEISINRPKRQLNKKHYMEIEDEEEVLE